jgi:hypothetical protein
MNTQSIPSAEGEPIVQEEDTLDEFERSALSPEEQDAFFLDDEKVLGGGYLKLKRRRLRRRGKPIRRTMWEPAKKR